MEKELCPICGEGELTPMSKEILRTIDGTIRFVKLQYQVCSECDCETALEDDLVANYKQMKDLYKKQ